MGRATSKGNEAKSKDETFFKYGHAEIRTQMVVICGPTRYQLDHGGATYSFDKGILENSE